MKPSQMNAGKLIQADASAILKHLTSRQHLRPHTPIAEVLEQTTQLFGCCPQAIERGMQWLGIQSRRPIGRFRRSELVQLANAVLRFWMQNVAAAEQ